MTDLSPAVIEAIADRLYRAEQIATTIDPVRDELSAGGVAAAYAVQNHNSARRLAGGAKLIGRKIGLTSKAVQQQLGVDEPDFGALFDDMILDSGDTLLLDEVLQPRAEAEVAVKLCDDLDGGDLTVEDFAGAVEYVCAAIEIVGSRIRDWDISILDTIADNASCGRFVLSSDAVPPTGVDLPEVSMRLLVDGNVESTGTASACLGHPYNAGVLLARRMVDEGTPLRAGDIVLTGALGPMVDLLPGAHILAEVGSLGSVSVSRQTDH